MRGDVLYLAFLSAGPEASANNAAQAAYAAVVLALIAFPIIVLWAMWGDYKDEEDVDPALEYVHAALLTSCDVLSFLGYGDVLCILRLNLLPLLLFVC